MKVTFDRYAAKTGRSLRQGYTTGTCAALAARAATRMLLSGRAERTASLITPKGVPVRVELADASLSDDVASCAVRKDAGDDPDVTNGALVYATVRRLPGEAVVIDGGAGVGRVTRPGLDQPVGEAAINRVPRRMIEDEVRSVCDEFGYDGGIGVVVSVPDGEHIAAKTFNPRLGIMGGVSIIGTRGIVEPMSTWAMLDAIGVEMNVLRAEGNTALILTPGNYGENVLRTMPGLSGMPYVKCSNFIGETLDMAVTAGFERILLAGHLGKMAKLAGGVMDTHSRVADCRLELLALHAALADFPTAALPEILAAATVEEGLARLGTVRNAAVASLLDAADRYCRRRTGEAVEVGVVTFANQSDMKWISKGAAALLAAMELEKLKNGKMEQDNG